MKREIIHHGDNSGLEPWIGPDGAGCGFVDEVNGRASALEPDFIPTRHEIELLAEHWAHEILDQDLFYWEYQTTGSTEIRLAAFARRRLDRACRILGDGAYERVHQQVEARAEQSLGSEVWRSFCQWRESAARESSR